jgi:predicted anti-sigma-YlaC factor YlaD
MNCIQSLMSLSDFHDGLLSNVETAQVRAHLTLCPSCQEVFHDLELIVTTAAELRDEDCVTCPSEKVGWQRLQMAALNSSGSAVGQQWLGR